MKLSTISDLPPKPRRPLVLNLHRLSRRHHQSQMILAILHLAVVPRGGNLLFLRLRHQSPRKLRKCHCRLWSHSVQFRHPQRCLRTKSFLRWYRLPNLQRQLPSHLHQKPRPRIRQYQS
ncbi:hypothetical protein MGG_16146 [Pyricularia oryzae 70-15]|uniref:Uncharacterized protein n=1 Tax=Pyricularia oryzae (strain 70-15 / ATCC MYA-4617 / FGSC 8958) TaxID=242507 RepID=G4MKP8_PYRO7|nr:uncharacterized protein MGG_16146 [Pyricularia oryzae 70-15]EHA56738.1 hypothetical protein MGG_16146 [Pyricularia oryzae 70-15]